MICSLVTTWWASRPNSAEMRPRRITTTRWAMLTGTRPPRRWSRGRARPSALARAASMPEDLRLRSDVDTACSVRRAGSRWGSVDEHLADDDLLLISPRQRADHRADGPDGLDRVRSRIALHRRACVRIGRATITAGPAHEGSRWLASDMICVRRSSSARGRPAGGPRGPDAIPAAMRSAMVSLLMISCPSSHHLGPPDLRHACPKTAFEQFGAPGAHQPVDADDLARPAPRG